MRRGAQRCVRCRMEPDSERTVRLVRVIHAAGSNAVKTQNASSSARAVTRMAGLGTSSITLYRWRAAVPIHRRTCSGKPSRMAKRRIEPNASDVAADARNARVGSFSTARQPVNGSTRSRSHVASCSSSQMPDATSRISCTTCGSGAMISQPLTPRNVYIATKAMRLLPSLYQ
jgi:hypothetical protein